jgi:hypothetical protein
MGFAVLFFVCFRWFARCSGHLSIPIPKTPGALDVFDKLHLCQDFWNSGCLLFFFKQKSLAVCIQICMPALCASVALLPLKCDHIPKGGAASSFTKDMTTHHAH